MYVHFFFSCSKDFIDLHFSYLFHHKEKKNLTGRRIIKKRDLYAVIAFY